MPAVRAFLGILALSNLPLLYPEMGSSFLKMVFSTGITTALYPYAVIPLAEVVFLSFINYHQIRIEASRIFRRMIFAFSIMASSNRLPTSSRLRNLSPWLCCWIRQRRPIFIFRKSEKPRLRLRNSCGRRIECWWLPSTMKCCC